MHFIGTSLGFFGISKYVLDWTLIDSIHNFQEAITESLKQRGNLSHADQQLIVLDMANRLWGKAVDDPNKRLHWWAE